MKIKMKRFLSDTDIQNIISKNHLGIVSERKQLSGGEFNTVYKVVTDKGQYVIKIAPDNASLLTYEKNIAWSEKFALEKLSDNSYVKLPKVIACSSDSNAEYNYLIIEFVEGEMLLNQKLGKEEYNNVMFALGKAVAELHNTECELGFGYLQNGLKRTWREAYFSMVDNIIHDAEKVNCKIPYLDEIRNIFHECSYVFNEVKTPSILHFDLWQGNIFIKDGKLFSIIDFERTILGDPIGDFIHLDYMPAFDIHKNKYLIDGYNFVAKNKLSFNKNEMIRLYLMRVYLGLIAYVEPYYRFSKLNFMFYARRGFAKRFMRVTLNELKKLI